MLTIDDCIALSGLTEAEIAAIAEHEHIPFTAATELGRCLCASDRGLDVVRTMVLDDLWAARRRGDTVHVRELSGILDNFAANHAEDAPVRYDA